MMSVDTVESRMDHEGLGKSKDALLNDRCVRKKQTQFLTPEIANTSCQLQRLFSALNLSVRAYGDVSKAPSLSRQWKEVEERHECTPINRKGSIGRLYKVPLCDTPYLAGHA
jgi:hypothetical protein